MIMKKGKDLSYLLNLKPDPDSMKWDHALDISASVYMRMKEMGIGKKELARRMGVNPSVVTRIIKGEQNLTLKTLAKLEHALDMDMSEGFRNPVPWAVEEPVVEHSTITIPIEVDSTSILWKSQRPEAMDVNFTLIPQGV